MSQSEEAHACRCGAAWALSYKAELNEKFKTTFKGSILHFGLDGAGRGSLASGLEGTFDLVVNADGNVLVSGIHNDAFSDSMVLTIAPDGTVLQPPLADGFAFSTGMFFDATQDEPSLSASLYDDVSDIHGDLRRGLANGVDRGPHLAREPRKT